MSSRGSVPTWVIEKQQKRRLLSSERQSAKQVRQQIAKVSTAVRAQMAALNNEEVNALGRRRNRVCSTRGGFDGLHRRSRR